MNKVQFVIAACHHEPATTTTEATTTTTTTTTTPTTTTTTTEATTTTAHHAGTCTDSDFVVTVDNHLELYIDGVQVSSGLPHANTWPTADTVSVAASAKVIAIKGVDVGSVAGILASGADSTTDGSWKCTNNLDEGWADEGFDDSAWPAATVIGDHGVSPWKIIQGISNDAKWIWTANNIYGPLSDKTVYCRKRRGNCLCI